MADTNRITAKTKLCAVIGDPVEHSLSPQLHNAAFNACGIDMTYCAFHVKKGDVRRALDGLRSFGIQGLSVTIPHKIDIVPYLDEIDPVAVQIGSINTVVNTGEKLIGYSTDGQGALRALKEKGVAVAERRILMLGSGGAARAIAFTLATIKPRPNLKILGVAIAELEELVKDIGVSTAMPVSGEELTPGSLSAHLSISDIVINASPIGMHPDTGATLVPQSQICEDHVVFDIVYTPFETRLLREAAEVGATIVPGLGMFVHQAAVQFELWTGQSAPVDVMRKCVEEALGGVR